MEKGKLEELSTKLISEKGDFMSSLKKNIDMYIAQPDITIKKLAEMADIPNNTLNNLLYNNTRDCKLSTVIKLAKALNVSIDELVGVDTLSDMTRENLSILRNLPVRQRHLVHWFVRNQEKLFKSQERPEKMITVMEPECDSDQNIFPTSKFSTITLDNFDDDICSKVFMGIQVVCNKYMPDYTPYDTLLIATDRNPKFCERCAVVYYGKIFIVSKSDPDRGNIETSEFTGINDHNFRVKWKELDDYIGYIAAVKTNYSF